MTKYEITIEYKGEAIGKDENEAVRNFKQSILSGDTRGFANSIKELSKN